MHINFGWNCKRLTVPSPSAVRGSNYWEQINYLPGSDGYGKVLILINMIWETSRPCDCSRTQVRVVGVGEKRAEIATRQAPSSRLFSPRSSSYTVIFIVVGKPVNVLSAIRKPGGAKNLSTGTLFLSTDVWNWSLPDSFKTVTYSRRLVLPSTPDFTT